MSSWVSMKDAGGAVAGAVVPAVFHPIELIKFRWQVYDKNTSIRPQYNSYKHAITSIYKQSKFSGLYAGVTPNIIGSSLAWGSYFFIYDKLKQLQFSEQTANNLVNTSPVNTIQKTPFTSSLLNNSFSHGFIAGLITQTFTNPFWVIKTQACLNYSSKQKTTAQITKEIYKKRGFAGFYKGFIPGLANTVHGGVQMWAYEELKKLNPIKNSYGGDMVNGFFAKVFTVCLLYPISTVKVRLQEQHSEEKKVRVVVSRIFEQHGVQGFYRGLAIQLLRQPLATGMTFLLYEWWKRTFS